LLSYTRILCMVAVVLFFSPITGGSRQDDLPVCSSLPEHGQENQVALAVAPVGDNPGVVCVRVDNGRPESIYYDWAALRLERRWVRLMWSSILRPKDLFPGRQASETQPVLRYIKEKSFRDFFLPSQYNPAPPGIYRVRFRYRLTEQGEEQTLYSETVTIQ